MINKDLSQTPHVNYRFDDNVSLSIVYFYMTAVAMVTVKRNRRIYVQRAVLWKANIVTEQLAQTEDIMVILCG